MRKLKLNIIALLGASMITLSTQGQQSSRLWLWHMDPYTVNPALIGMDYEAQVSTYYGNHYSSIPNAPRNYGVLAAGKLNGSNAGIGLNLNREVVGFESVFNGMVSYKYGIPVFDKHLLSMGMSLGVLHQNFNLNSLYYHDLNESTVNSINNNPERTSFDANVGMSLISPTYYIGLSTNRFIQNKLEYEAQNSKYTYLYKPRINLIGGYRFKELAKDIDLDVNAFTEYQSNSPIFYSVNARAFYKNKAWLGLGYGAVGQVGIQAGVKPMDRVNIGYYYMAGGLTNDYNLGSGHELFLSYSFPTSQKQLPPKIVEKVVTETVHDTIFVQKTDTVIKTIKVAETPKTDKKKETFKKDKNDNVVVDRLAKVDKTNIDTTKMVFKDVSKSRIKPGYYVVVSTFGVQANADNYLKQLLASGQQAFKFYDAGNKYYYIYIHYSTDYNQAHKAKDEHPDFEGIWVKRYE